MIKLCKHFLYFFSLQSYVTVYAYILHYIDVLINYLIILLLSTLCSIEYHLCGILMGSSQNKMFNGPYMPCFLSLL